jgi:hypothetical protein
VEDVEQIQRRGHSGACISYVYMFFYCIYCVYIYIHYIYIRYMYIYTYIYIVLYTVYIYVYVLYCIYTWICSTCQPLESWNSRRSARTWLCRSMLLAGNRYRKLAGACSRRDRRNATHTHNEFMTEHEPGALIKSPHMSKPWRCLRQFSGMIESSVLDVRRQNGWLAEQLAWSSQQAQTQAPIAKQGKGFLPFLGPTLATDTGW